MVPLANGGPDRRPPRFCGKYPGRNRPLLDTLNAGKSAPCATLAGIERAIGIENGIEVPVTPVD